MNCNIVQNASGYTSWLEYNILLINTVVVLQLLQKESFQKETLLFVNTIVKFRHEKILTGKM